MWKLMMGWGGGMGRGKCRELYIKCVIVIQLSIKQTLITQLLPLLPTTPSCVFKQ